MLALIGPRRWVILGLTLGALAMWAPLLPFAAVLLWLLTGAAGLAGFASLSVTPIRPPGGHR